MRLRFISCYLAQNVTIKSIGIRIIAIFKDITETKNNSFNGFLWDILNDENSIGSRSKAPRF